MSDGIDRIYEHRHNVPVWSKQGADDLAAEVGSRAVEWLVAHVLYEHDRRDEHMNRLTRALLDLGVTTWWALRQLDSSPFERNEVAVAAAAVNRHASEEWASASAPLTEFARVVGNRLNSALMTLATMDLPTSSTEKVRRQLLFVTAEIEQMLAYLPSL